MFRILNRVGCRGSGSGSEVVLSFDCKYQFDIGSVAFLQIEFRVRYLAGSTEAGPCDRI